MDSLSVIVGLVLITGGSLQLFINRRIARVFDKNIRGFQSTSRQNIVGSGILIVACGLALVFFK